MRIRRRVQVLFAALFAVLAVGVGFDASLQAERNRVVEEIDQHLVPARTELARLLTALLDQETGQRGFLLTGDETFLEPYRTGRQDSEEALARLRSLLADDRTALAAVSRVSSRVSAWQQLAADFEILTKRSGREEIVGALVGSGTGKRLFDLVRAEISDLRLALDERLEDRLDRRAELLDRHERLRLTSLVVAVVLLGLAGHLLGRWVGVPLARLNAAVRATAAGALHEPIPATGPPELAELASDVDAMRRRLLAEVDDATRARAALADRGMIVVTLRDDLGPTDVELPAGISLAGRFRPAKGMVAGDWYDAVRLDDDRLALALVDVSGHGAEVATFALRTKTLTMAALASYEPAEALAWLASRLGESGELFLTGVIIELSASTGVVRYASAGHPPLLLAGLTGVTELPATGPLLGPLPGTWTTGEAVLDRGGVLVAYSDGLVEPRDEHGEMFGVHSLSRVVSDRQLEGVHAVADAAIRAVEQFAAVEGSDDITLCVLGR